MEFFLKLSSTLRGLLQYTGLTKPLPQNVQILTLEPWIGFSFLLRLEHVYETGQALSQPVVVALKVSQQLTLSHPQLTNYSAGPVRGLYSDQGHRNHLGWQSMVGG